MKTAVQQIIDKLEARYEKDKKIYERLQESVLIMPENIEKAKGKMYSSRDAWKLACTMLQTEKEQIMEAHEAGAESEYQHFVNCRPMLHEEIQTPEAYYNQTFNQK